MIERLAPHTGQPIWECNVGECSATAECPHADFLHPFRHFNTKNIAFLSSYSDNRLGLDFQHRMIYSHGCALPPCDCNDCSKRTVYGVSCTSVCSYKLRRATMCLCETTAHGFCVNPTPNLTQKYISHANIRQEHSMWVGHPHCTWWIHTSAPLRLFTKVRTDTDTHIHARIRAVTSVDRGRYI